MPRNGDPPFEEWVPLQEELVQAVHFGCHRVHDGLAIGGAVVKENVQDGVVDEVTQAIDARQSDSLQVTVGGGKERGNCSWGASEPHHVSKAKRKLEDCHHLKGHNVVI